MPGISVKKAVANRLAESFVAQLLPLQVQSFGIFTGHIAQFIFSVCNCFINYPGDLLRSGIRPAPFRVGKAFITFCIASS